MAENKAMESDSEPTEEEIRLQIKLPTPVTFSSTVRPVCLPTKSEATLALSSLSALALGWGVTSDRTSELSRTLQEAEVRTITNTECELQFPMVVRSTNLCISGEGGRATCSGDSGKAVSHYTTEESLTVYYCNGIIVWWYSGIMI